MFGNNVLEDLLVLLSTEPGVAIGQFDSQLLSTLHNNFPLPCRNVVGDLSAELVVLGHQDLKLHGVPDRNLVEAIGQHVLCFLI